MSITVTMATEFWWS